MSQHGIVRWTVILLLAVSTACVGACDTAADDRMHADPRSDAPPLPDIGTEPPQPPPKPPPPFPDPDPPPGPPLPDPPPGPDPFPDPQPPSDGRAGAGGGSRAHGQLPPPSKQPQ